MAQKQVTFVNPVDPVGSQIALQQLQRQQALADALRERALSPLQGNGGNIAWTQGLAQIGQALAARIMQNRIDKRTAQVGYDAANATRGMFGVPPIQPQQPAQYKTPIAQQMDPNAGASPPQAPQQQTIDLPGRGAVPLGSQAAPQQPAQAPQMPQEAQAPEQAPQQAGGYPMALTGNPQTDYGYYVQNPEEYTKAVIAAHAPTDLAKRIVAAGIPPGSPLFKQLMQSNIAKENYIAPVNGRPGSTLRDPYDPTKVIGYDAPTVDGGIPIYGPNGEFQGYKVAPGAAQITGQMTAARTGAEAAAKAPYELIQVWNPDTGQMELRPKSDATGGVTAGGAGRGPGPIDSALSGGGGSGHFAAGPSLGTPGAVDVLGRASADRFNAIQTAAQDSPQRISALREMQGLVASGMATGPTADLKQRLAEKYGMTWAANDNAFIFNKDAARYTSQLAGELGLNGSDARLGMVGQATPGMKITPAALNQIIPTYIGLELAKQARANAAASWAQSNPTNSAAFETWWRNNYDPRMFTQLSRGRQAFVDNIRKLDPKSQDYYRKRFNALANAGALQGIFQ